MAGTSAVVVGATSLTQPGPEDKLYDHMVSVLVGVEGAFVPELEDVRLEVGHGREISWRCLGEGLPVS